MCEKTGETMSYTPGPWEMFETDGDTMEIVTSSDNNIVITDIRSLWSENTDEQKANAALIAAAPELLDALKRCIGNHCPNAAAVFCSSCTEALKIIAKAEGR